MPVHRSQGDKPKHLSTFYCPFLDRATQLCLQCTYSMNLSLPWYNPLVEMQFFAAHSHNPYLDIYLVLSTQTSLTLPISDHIFGRHVSVIRELIALEDRDAFSRSRKEFLKVHCSQYEALDR